MNDLNFLRANGVNVEESVNTLGIETYNEVLNMFLDEIVDKVNKLQENLINKNMVDYATYVHAIKGEAHYLGFDKLVNLALDHQLRSQENNCDYIQENFNELIQEIARVIKVSKIYLGKA